MKKYIVLQEKSNQKGFYEARIINEKSFNMEKDTDFVAFEIDCQKYLMNTIIYEIDESTQPIYEIKNEIVINNNTK